MVSCTDCVHYEACKMWHEGNDTLVGALNNLLGVKDYPPNRKSIPYLHFPRVAETKEELCDNYEKRKRI